MVPSLPMATPRGSPGSAQRRMTRLPPEVRLVSVSGVGAAGWANVQAAAVASSTRVVSLIVRAGSVFERVGEFLDDGVGKEPLTHLSKLGLDFLSCLPSFRKRDSKQLAHADIFHPREFERAQRV